MGAEASPDACLNFEALLEATARVEDCERQGDDLAGIFYTGGTTGTPKGVTLSHGNIFANSLALTAVCGNTRNSVCLHATPMFHMADAAVGFSQVICGGTHVTSPSFVPDAVLRTIQDERVTLTLLATIMIQMLGG